MAGRLGVALRRRRAGVIALLGLVVSTNMVSTVRPALAQAPLSQRIVPTILEDALDNTAGADPLSRKNTLRVPDARWLRVVFATTDLGKGSAIEVAGPDGAVHRLDARAVRDWGNTSAYFNGEELSVTLSVPKGGHGSYRIERVIADGPPEPAPGGRNVEIPIGTDDRAYARDERVGRVVPIGCTAWLTSTGLGLSAGHCNPPAGQPGFGKFQTIQFNVPPSNANGVINQPKPEDQFPVIAGSIVGSPWSVGTVPKQTPGNDWMVFHLGPPAALPAHPNRQRPFFRLVEPPMAPLPQPGQITGYGAYPAPPGPPDARNQTEQTQVGSYLGICRMANGLDALNYKIDTASGNSGSPVFLPGTDIAFGIHTTGVSPSPPPPGTDIAFGIHTTGLSAPRPPCAAGPVNLGTPSTNANFLAALTIAVQGPNTAATFVDFAQPTTDPIGAGTPLNPYRDLATAVTHAAAGQATVLNLAPGHYAPNGITIAADAAAGSVIIIGTSAGTIGIGPYPRAGP